MRTLSNLIQEKSTLPIGNIYKKQINGKTYFYHQYFLNGKRISKIVKSHELINLETQINKRIEIEKQIKILQSKNKNVTLSKKACELTGYIMNRNTPVAEFENAHLVWLDEKRAPLVIVKTRSIEKFLELRVLDMSRTNARILKKILNIHAKEEYEIPLYSYALAINDKYWFKPKHSKLKYKDIVFNNDNFSEAALKGDTTFFPHQANLTPEITTTGSYEKGWKLINKEWWLYKSGSQMEYFSELYSYHFSKLINIESAVYEMDNGYIRTKNFSKNTNFEPLASIAGANDDYNFVFNLLISLNQDIARDYLKLIFFDAVIFNIDRHNENLGLLRDVKNGKIISLSPNFDNNLSLLATSPILKEPEKDNFINSFITFLKTNQTVLSLFKTIDFPLITKEHLAKLLDKIPIKIENSDDFTQILLNRYNFILTHNIIKKFVKIKD